MNASIESMIDAASAVRSLEEMQSILVGAANYDDCQQERPELSRVEAGGSGETKYDPVLNVCNIIAKADSEASRFFILIHQSLLKLAA